MTRIIAGTLGGRRLATPKGARTRPTSDRVREAVFSRLEALMDLRGALVLDLYAGSGALGIEAASRGAAAVLAVESDREVAQLIRRNVDHLGLANVVRVRADDVARVLASGPAATAYDLAFADPPYAIGDDELGAVLGALVEKQWAAPGARVVIERARRAGPPRWPAAVTPLDSRTYGDTTVHVGTVAVGDSPAAGG